MRSIKGAGGLGFTLAATLALAACSGEKRADTVTQAPVAPPPAAAPVAPIAPVTPTTTVLPESAQAIDAALAAAKAFNAKAQSDIAAIDKAEKRVREQAARALEAARRGDLPRATAARGDAEAARKSLVDGLAAFNTATAEQQTAVTAALALCGPPLPTPGSPVSVPVPPPPPVTTPTPGAAPTTAPSAVGYEGCATLAAEQALMTRNIDAVSNRYRASETAFLQDRPKLEEAAAILALGKLGPS